jgi:hypothetical protein
MKALRQLAENDIRWQCAGITKIHLTMPLSFFVVKPVKSINMKSNVCNSLNCSAQYIGRHD